LAFAIAGFAGLAVGLAVVALPVAGFATFAAAAFSRFALDSRSTLEPSPAGGGRSGRRRCGSDWRRTCARQNDLLATGRCEQRSDEKRQDTHAHF
jgi:hypothetical protein